MKRQLVFLAMTLLLTSCGGGGGNTVSTFETPTLTAYYVDAPVKGLIYEASPSGLSGVTDERGAFNFKQGDTVKLYIRGADNILIFKGQPSNQSVYLLAEDYINEISTNTLPSVLNALDQSGLNDDFIDLTNVNLSQQSVQVIKRLLDKKVSVDSSITFSDRLYAVQQAEGGVYKTSFQGVNTDIFTRKIIEFFSAMPTKKIKNDFSNKSFMVQSTNSDGSGSTDFFEFLNDGSYKNFDGVSIKSGYYQIDDGVLQIGEGWGPGATDCDQLINEKYKTEFFGYYTITRTSSSNPLTCNEGKSSFQLMSQVVNVDYLSGKTIEMPFYNINCLTEPAYVNRYFSFSNSVNGAGGRDFTSTSSCAGDTPLSGSVTDFEISGVVKIHVNQINMDVFLIIDSQLNRANYLTYDGKLRSKKDFRITISN